MQTPPAKRFRPAPPPYHRVLRAVGGQKMRVRLTPAAETDVCPLSMGPAAEDELDFLPGVAYLPGLPHIRLMTLPCRHSFGAMSLLYHFARQNMLCPCCRQGVGARIHPSSIPPHFRATLLRRVESAELLELRQQMASDAAAARELDRAQGAAVAVFIDPEEIAWASGLDLLQATPTVDMSVFAHLAEDDSPPHVSFQFQLVSRSDRAAANNAPGGLVDFEMPLAEHRRLASQLEEMAVTRISLVVHARSAANRVVQLARTDPVPVRSPGGATDAPRALDTGTSTLFLHPLQGSDALSHVTWVAQAQTFDSLMEHYA